MRATKLRGLKRKTSNMVRRVEEETAAFPSVFYNDYWHLKLPVAQELVSSSNTPYGIKQLCIKTLLSRAEYLVMLKPESSVAYRVVVMIDLPELWNSQIIVFQGDAYFDVFFDRDEWMPLKKERDFASEWGITIPEMMQVVGFKEVIEDEDGFTYEGEYWFIGDFK